MHLYIEQNTGLTENVSSSVVKKLYELASGGTLDATSDLKGTLHTTIMGAREKAYLEGMFSDFHVTADEYSLTFEDPEVENICVTNWGSNGAVTLNQLQAVTTTNLVFKGNTTITKFNEFQYFTGLQNPAATTNQLFSGCTNLEEITLPSNLTMMASNMFLNCTSLENITIPVSVQKIENAFIGCTALKSVVATGITGKCVLGRELTSLETFEVNEGCTEMGAQGSKLTSVNVPASVQYVRLKENKNLTTVTFAQNSNLIGLSNESFYRCSNLTTINNFPSTYTSLGGQTFEGCTNLRTMIPLPVGCTKVPGNCYLDCQSMAGEFIIPATVTSIGEYAFRRTDSFTGIKIYATTPPTIDVKQFGSLFSNASSNNNPAVGYPIYVPQSALATYQADTNWSKFGSRLQGFTP